MPLLVTVLESTTMIAEKYYCSRIYTVVSYSRLILEFYYKILTGIVSGRNSDSHN